MEVFVPPCVSTPEFIHAAMRPDVITETVVEVSTEESEPMDASPVPTSPDIHEPMKKKKGVYGSSEQQSQNLFPTCTASVDAVDRGVGRLDYLISLIKRRLDGELRDMV